MLFRAALRLRPLLGRVAAGEKAALASSSRVRSYATAEAAPAAEADGIEAALGGDVEPKQEWAYNDIEKKKGLRKPEHTIADQIAYMNSEVFARTYKGLPIYKWYRRNLKVQLALQPPPRMFCIDKTGRFNVNHACPVCRDEYLFFDYRNPTLIEQFMLPGTDQPLELLKTGLCRDQYVQLRAQLLKAREHGYIEFCVEYRVFDYSQWYDNWRGKSVVADDDGQPLSRHSTDVASLFPTPPVHFPPHKRNTGNAWDEYWHRHAKFARLSK